WAAQDVPGGAAAELTQTSGAVDATERLLAQALVRDDAVAPAAPCLPSSLQTVRHPGYRPLPAPVDEARMRAGPQPAARDHGARAPCGLPTPARPGRRGGDAAGAAACGARGRGPCGRPHPARPEPHRCLPRPAPGRGAAGRAGRTPLRARRARRLLLLPLPPAL